MAHCFQNQRWYMKCALACRFLAMSEEEQQKLLMQKEQEKVLED